LTAISGQLSDRERDCRVAHAPRKDKQGVIERLSQGVDMNIKKGVLKSFDAGNYKATLQMAGSDKVYLEGVAVAKNIASAAMVTGSRLAVVVGVW
jgi:hypothetical protein